MALVILSLLVRLAITTAVEDAADAMAITWWDSAVVGTAVAPNPLDAPTAAEALVGPAVLRGLLRRGRPPVHELDMQPGARGDPFVPIHLEKRPLCAAPESAWGLPDRRTAVGRRPPTRVRRAVRARSCSKRVVRRAAPGVETHARRAGVVVEPGLRRARPKNPRRGPLPGGTLLQRAGPLLREQRVPALRDEIGNDGAYIAKGPKLGLDVGGRRVELCCAVIVPRSLEHPAFRQDGVPDRERRAVLAHDFANGQQRLRPPLAVH